MDLLQSLVAAMIGTVAMTLSSTTEMHLRERPESIAPGKGAAFWLRFVGIRIDEDSRGMRVLSTWAHWIYGTAWGVVWWLLVPVAGLPLWLAPVILFVIVWVFAASTYVLYGVAPWPWRWGGFRWVLLDWLHHGVYAVGTTVGWVLLEAIRRGS